MPVEPVVDKPPESVLPEGQAPNLTCPRFGTSPEMGLRILGLLRAVELVRRSKSTVLGKTAITLRSVVDGMNLG